MVILTDGYISVVNIKSQQTKDHTLKKQEFRCRIQKRGVAQWIVSLCPMLAYKHTTSCYEHFYSMITLQPFYCLPFRVFLLFPLWLVLMAVKTRCNLTEKNKLTNTNTQKNIHCSFSMVIQCCLCLFSVCTHEKRLGEEVLRCIYSLCLTAWGFKCVSTAYT